MNTKFIKWSRLLFVFALVMSLAFALAPAAVMAQAPCPTCPKVDCTLQVNIVTPADKETFVEGECYWVNATVARPQGIEVIQDVRATIAVAGGAELKECCPTQPNDTLPGVELNDCNPVADFWWKVCCTSADPAVNPVTIAVSATGLVTDDPRTPDNCQGQTVSGSDKISVNQVLPTCDPCVVVEIIECPQNPIDPSTVFGVKAKVHNVCDVMICDIKVEIDIDGPASLVYPDLKVLDLGCIYPDRYEEVGWQLHCDGPGDVKFTVKQAEGTTCYKQGDCDGCIPGPDIPDPIDPCAPCPPPDPCAGRCVVQPDSCTVVQKCTGYLTAELVDPVEKVCVSCNNCFQIKAEICNPCIFDCVKEVKAELVITGDYQLVGADTLQKIVCPQLDPGACTTVVWNVCCTGDTDLQYYVKAWGNSCKTGAAVAAQVPPPDAAGAATYAIIEQLPYGMIDIMDPPDGSVYNVCEEYPFTYKFTNCSSTSITGVKTGVDLTSAPNVVVAGTTAHVVYNQPHTPQQEDLPITQDPNNPDRYYVTISCACCCEFVTITFPLKCTGSGMTDFCTWPTNPDTGKPIYETLVAYAEKTGIGLLDDDSIEVKQMCKAHLAGALHAFEGTASLNNLENCFEVQEVAVGESFTIIAAVANEGETAAQGVEVTLAWTGPATSQMDPVQVIGDIGCHGAAKAIWEFECFDEGRVEFWIESITAIDANTGEPVHLNNTETGCPIYIDQIPFTVEIIQPLTCTSFVEYESFTVKAAITNGSTMGKTLECVFAELRWDSDEEGCDPCGDFELAPFQPKVVTATPGEDTLLPGETAEVTWQVRCCAAGDVTFWVDVWTGCEEQEPPVDCASEPDLDITSSRETIHQWEPGHICCYIVSPRLMDFDICWDGMNPEAYIATSQEFSVTGKIFNSGQRPFTVESLELLATDWPLGSADISAPTPAPPFDIPPEEEVTVSFDLHCTAPGPTWLALSASGRNDQGIADSCCHEILVAQYSAAHLEVNITDYPQHKLAVGEEFSVTAMVTNTGDADAWEVQAHLDVFPAGAVRISTLDPDGGYNKFIGNLTGHGVHQSKPVTWLLKSIDPSPSTTLTISASGFDEYGFEVKQICTSKTVEDGGPPFQITCCELLLDGTPGAPILDRFIEPDSVTVEDPEGGDPGEGGDTVDIALGAGWNLISLPWYIEATDRDIESLLADVLANLDSVYAYQACGTPGWTNYVTSGPPGMLTQMRDGPGYWVKMNAAGTLSVTGDLGPADPMEGMPSYQVCGPGWNLIGSRMELQPRP